MNVRKQKRIGFAILGLATAAMSIPMVYGAFSGLAAGRVWDPYTDQLLSEQVDAEATCLEAARELLMEAGRLDGIVPRWEEPMRAWTVRCSAKKYPESYRLLTEARHVLTEKRAASITDGSTGEKPPE